MDALTIVHVSSLQPTACGIAEYTAALAAHLHASISDPSIFWARLISPGECAAENSNIFLCDPSDRNNLDALAARIGQFRRKVVLLQHEFKLFGHPHGENVIQFLQQLDAPVVTTLHTVWPSFPPPRDKVFEAVVHRSTLLVVFSAHAARILTEAHGLDQKRVRVIPHGIPEAPFRLPRESFSPMAPQGTIKFITPGLIRPAKGIQFAISAMARVRSCGLDVSYVIAGKAHPNSPEAVSYYRFLQEEVNRLNLQDHVVFINRYLSNDELIALIQACNVGALPYTAAEQSSSGTLALILGCGRPVIASDFQHARSTIGRDNGIIVPIANVSELASAFQRLSQDASLRQGMILANYAATRTWCWSVVSAEYHQAIIDAERIFQSSVGLNPTPPD